MHVQLTHTRTRTAAALAACLLLSLPAQAADGTWVGLVEINPASDQVDDAGPECRDGRVRLVLTVEDGTAQGRLEPIGNPGAPGFDRGPIALSGTVSPDGMLELRSGSDDHFYNRLSGTLDAGDWRNAACWGEYRLTKSS